MGRVEALCNRKLMNEDFLQHYAWVKQIDAQALATRCVSVTWEKVLKLVC